DDGRRGGRSEVGIFGEEAVARMNAIGPGTACRRDQPVDREIAVARRRRPDRQRRVAGAHMERARVGFGVHRDGAQAEMARGARDAHRDLAAVRDQDGGEHVRAPDPQAITDRVAPFGAARTPQCKAEPDDAGAAEAAGALGCGGAAGGVGWGGGARAGARGGVGRRGVTVPVVARGSDFVSALASDLDSGLGSAPLASALGSGSAVMMFTGGIEAAEGKSYFDGTAVATGGTAALAGPVTTRALCARAAHSGA